MKSLVIIPTYNERENVEAITSAALKITASDTNHETHVLVVDDNSPDGTGDIVKKLMVNENRLHLLSRAQKQGLGDVISDKAGCPC